MLKIGHRGARAYEPENTLRSFKKAIELGVDAVELDVRQTRDLELVVMHDPIVDKTTNGQGAVKDLTMHQIKSFDAPKGEKTPTLTEALDFIDKKVKIIIELKEIGYEEKVVETIREKGLEKNVIMVSFHEDALRKIRTLNHEIETGLIYVNHKNPIKAALDLKAQYLLPLYRFVHTANVQKAHDNELKVIVWTINTPEEAGAYAKKGVDGIASDRPDIFTL